MGQSLPLPERIPVPSDNDTELMKEMGFKFGEIVEDHIKYVLPEKWTLKNSSSREDLPNWYFVDEKNMKRIQISGSWKGSYDNELNLRILETPKKFEEPKKSPIPNETSPEKMREKFRKALLKTALEKIEISQSDSNEEVVEKMKTVMKQKLI